MQLTNVEEGTQTLALQSVVDFLHVRAESLIMRHRCRWLSMNHWQHSSPLDNLKLRLNMWLGKRRLWLLWYFRYQHGRQVVHMKVLHCLHLFDW